MPRVLNKRTASAEELQDAVYVGRPTQWGNPFVIGRDGDRSDCVRKYASVVAGSRRSAIRRELQGRDLVCWCAPKPCHADVLLMIANEENTDADL